MQKVGIDELDDLLHNQLQATDETLAEWESDKYLADGQTVAEFWRYIQNAPFIIIIGDYDVDGKCAEYILLKSIKSVYPNKKVRVRTPRRFSEGYGINEIIADEIIRDIPKESLVITVDNGLAASSVLNKIKMAGFNVIVTDHHRLKDNMELPEVDMIINPMITRIINPLQGDYWCGTGVVYKLCEQIVDTATRNEIMVYTGLATLADSMPLREGNWGLVRSVLKSFRDGNAPKALKDLLDNMGRDSLLVNEDSFNYYLGPAINAPGRLLDNGTVKVSKYMYQPSIEGCTELIEINNERKTIRDEELKELIEYIETHNIDKLCPIWVKINGLHEGIIGILAGKIAEKYKKPAIILTNTKEGYLKGSGRSIGNFDLFEYLMGIPKECFIKLGGHTGAAGMTLTEEGFEQARMYQVSEENINVEDDGII